MNLDKSNIDISMQGFGQIICPFRLIVSIWDNSKKKRKGLQKTRNKGLVRVEWSQLDGLNRIAIRQPLWMFRRMILEFDGIQDMNNWFTLGKKHTFMLY